MKKRGVLSLDSYLRGTDNFFSTGGDGVDDAAEEAVSVVAAVFAAELLPQPVSMKAAAINTIMATNTFLNLETLG